MSGHFELGEIIKNHKDSDIGKLSWHTISISSQHLLFFESIMYLPLQSPFFPLTICLTSPSISPRHIKPVWPSSRLAPSYSSPLNPHPWISHPHLQCPFWNRQSMFPSEKRAPTPCLSPHSIPTHSCALTAITPCPSLTLWPRPTRLQPIPTQDRYWGPLGGYRSADVCDIR